MFFLLTPPFHPQQGAENDRWKDMEFYNFMDVISQNLFLYCRFKTNLY